LVGLVCVSMHWLLHVARPPPHAHTPAVQFAPGPHTTLHAPQFDGSVVVSVQPLLQFVCEAAQVVVQTPFEQTGAPAAAEHAAPHAPQFLGSACVFVQTPSQRRPAL
jgi:hypothetical protein